MIIILTGAQKNLGDYLIGDRAKKLLREFVDEKIIEFSRFKPLDSYIDIINKSRCLILCGGPAYANNIYPDIYPLVSNLAQVKVPIVPFGLGWCGKPFRNQNKFRFSLNSLNFLQKIHLNIPYSSCRDNITKYILKKHNINNTIMTGCPVWYDLDYINKPFEKVEKIKRIVVTTGAKVSLFYQILKLIQNIRKQFINAELYLSFHRGILPDKQTSIKSSLVYMIMALASKLYRTKVVDVSYSLEKIDFYQNCDFHIGYRVHAHLYFLSKRKPSILINEDGRGMGMAEAMNIPIFNYDDKNLVSNVINQIKKYVSSNFCDLKKTALIIDENFEVMKSFLKSIA